MDIFSYMLGRKSGGGSGGGGVRLQDKTITENGEYTADAGYDGLGTVTVDVAGSGGSDEDWIIGDGNTHIWITLTEGRTSPMLGVGVNGTVTVDWGDGTEPDTLTGTSTDTVVYTPNHEYAQAGDYVITLLGDGEVGFCGTTTKSYLLGASSSANDTISSSYRNAVRKVECGSNVTKIGTGGFSSCYSLTSLKISGSVKSIAGYAVSRCYSLTSINIPDGVTSIAEYGLSGCPSLTSINIPGSVKSIGRSALRDNEALVNVNIGEGVTSIGDYAFYDCHALTSVNIPKSVTTISGELFRNCYSLASINIPDSVRYISSSAFYSCYSLTSLHIPGDINTIYNYAFQDCLSLVNVKFSGSIADVRNYAFRNCGSVSCFDFTQNAVVPTLEAAAVFTGIPSDCIFKIPASLYDEWVAATNWSSVAATYTFVGV